MMRAGWGSDGETVKDREIGIRYRVDDVSDHPEFVAQGRSREN
jgi:hypothetical protein